MVILSTSSFTVLPEPPQSPPTPPAMPSAPLFPPSPFVPPGCGETCQFRNDAFCDDGGPGSLYNECAL
eukprot:6278579-Prymnesium_polylepis.1